MLQNGRNEEWREPSKPSGGDTPLADSRPTFAPPLQIGGGFGIGLSMFPKRRVQAIDPATGEPKRDTRAAENTSRVLAAASRFLTEQRGVIPVDTPVVILMKHRHIMDIPHIGAALWKDTHKTAAFIMRSFGERTDRILQAIGGIIVKRPGDFLKDLIKPNPLVESELVDPEKAKERAEKMFALLKEVGTERGYLSDVDSPKSLAKAIKKLNMKQCAFLVAAAVRTDPELRTAYEDSGRSGLNNNLVTRYHAGESIVLYPEGTRSKDRLLNIVIDGEHPCTAILNSVKNGSPHAGNNREACFLPVGIQYPGREAGGFLSRLRIGAKLNIGAPFFAENPSDIQEHLTRRLSELSGLSTTGPSVYARPAAEAALSNENLGASAVSVLKRNEVLEALEYFRDNPEQCTRATFEQIDLALSHPHWSVPWMALQVRPKGMHFNPNMVSYHSSQSNHPALADMAKNYRAADS
ncbi:MAG: 1-acyl-sn-glycerol-3-phosphate acyltransferase [Bdellovibrionales bacterium]|nr:1-acyl-sn-glycerol-3-phosphate acyltransferase [Bdellovibrionales bacterium]